MIPEASAAEPSQRRRSLFPRVALAVPSWNGATYRAIVKCLVSGAVIDGVERVALRSLLIRQFGVEDSLLCGSGSLALELALRASGVGQGDEVVVPSFCCSAVVAPIAAVGAVAVLADVGGELNVTRETVLPALTKITKAIIVPHLFGNPAEVERIVDLAREKNILVIDDAAQAFGATIDGKWVGSFGDIGIVSFGAGKVCFGLGGGAFLLNRGNFSHAVISNLSEPRLARTLRVFLSTLIWRRARRWTLPIEKLLWPSDSCAAETRADDYRSESMANLNAAVALNLARSVSENIQARRVRVEAYRQLLGCEQGLELIPHRTGSAYLTQVVKVASRKRDLAIAVVQALHGAGYEVQGSYVPLHLLPQRSTCVWESLPYTERVWSDLIELPCEPGVSFSEIERITDIVKTTINR